MYTTVDAVKARLAIDGTDEDQRIQTIITQQSTLIDQKLAVTPDQDPALAVVLPIAAEEICTGEYLLAVAGENAVDGTLDISVLKIGPDPDKIAKRGNELVANGWAKLKAWLKPENPVFIGHFSGVDG
jgi:hypothetical protein